MKLTYLPSEGVEIEELHTYAAKITFDCGCSFSGAGLLESFIVCAEHGDWVAGVDEVQKQVIPTADKPHQHECDPIGRPASHDNCVCKCGATNVNGEGWE